MVAGTGRENGMETPMHENPEWEKARQALASISKAGAAGSSTKASSNGPVANAQVRSHTGLISLMADCWGRDPPGVPCITMTEGSEDSSGALGWGKQGLFP